MILLINIIFFVLSCFLLYFAGELIVKGLLKIATFFGVTEFVVAFFVMAVAASLPNLFVGITSALKGIPELSFGDILGNNLIALTLAIALAVIFSPNKEIPADGKTIQYTAIFTLISGVLPIILISDGIISRLDGLILILFFVYYIFWLFSKKERFSKVYQDDQQKPKNFLKNFKSAMLDLGKIIVGIFLLLISAQGVVKTSSFIATFFNLPLVFIGIVVLGLGSALPEIYFGIISARKGETSMILGNLMGAVIIPASLILGIVSIIKPIESDGLEFSLINRIFLILAIIFFFLFTKSNNKITKRESYILLSFYVVFVGVMILTSIIS